MAAEKKILVIHNNLTGDLNAAKGVAMALAGKYKANVEIANFKPRNAVFAKICRFLIRKNIFPNCLTCFFFKNFRCLANDNYIAIISSLGKSETAGVFLSKKYSIPLIHIGSPKKFRPDNFTYIITHAGNEAKVREIYLPVPPTQIFPDNVANERAYCALLLGGDFAGNEYSQECWQKILGLATKFAQEKQLKLCISTSRRTPKFVDDLLKKMVSEDIEVEIYDESGESRLHDFLNKSSHVFVTAESISMIADALAHNVPVYALAAPSVKYEKRIGSFLKQQKSQNNIAIVDCAEANFDLIDNHKFNLDRKHFSEYLLDAVEL